MVAISAQNQLITYSINIHFKQHNHLLYNTLHFDPFIIQFYNSIRLTIINIHNCKYD